MTQSSEGRRLLISSWGAALALGVACTVGCAGDEKAPAKAPTAGSNAGESGGESGENGGTGNTDNTGGTTPNATGGHSQGSGGSHRGGSGNSPGGAPGAGPSDPGVAGNAPYDWVGVVGTGQSLSVGWEAPAIHTSPSAFGNLMLSDSGPDPKYPIDASGSPSWSTVPLQEPIRVGTPGHGDSQEYPNNIWHAGNEYGESPHSGMADTISAICRARGHECLTAHTVVGVAGTPLTGIKANSRGFNAAIHEAGVFKTLAGSAGKTYGVGSIILTHGEADATTADYKSGVYQLWVDFNTQLKAATGQSEDVVMLASQQSSSASNFGATYGSAVQLWQASVEHPGKIVVTGPKYQYGPYGLHMGAASYARMGEKYGEVHDYIVNRKIDWRPVQPTSVTRAGAVLTIVFHVPNPPLVWDETLAKPHQAAHTAWSKGRGLEVIDGSGTELEISSVEIQGENVVLTLAKDPGSSAKLTLGYAVTQDTQDNFQGGKDLGPHGQLRDSDPFTGPSTDTVEYNYCVHFAMPVP